VENQQMQYGTKINGRLQPKYITALGEAGTDSNMTKPGEIYQFDIDVDQIPDETTAIQQTLTLEDKYPDLKVLYVETNPQTNKVTLQVADTGGDWDLGGILQDLPYFFIIAGIVIVGIILWQVYQQNPVYLYALLLIGGAITFFILVGSQLGGGVFKPTGVKKAGLEGKTGGERQERIKQKEASIEKRIDAHDKTMARAERLMNDCEARLEKARTTPSRYTAAEVSQISDECKEINTEQKAAIRDAENERRKAIADLAKLQP
jgi:hypothetical protein